MARIARVVVPGIPHHVTQRGNRGQRTFFREDDYELYAQLLVEWCARSRTEIWGYCFMPNHVHMILVPSSVDGLRIPMGEAHKRYTARINQREGWIGHLWQGRYFSCPMDEKHLIAAARYIETNPIRSGAVSSAEDFQWSSARAHVLGADDGIVRAFPLLERVPDWQDFLRQGVDSDEMEAIRTHQKTGRPLGTREFLLEIEQALGRQLRRRRPGARSRFELSEVSPEFFQQAARGFHRKPDHVGVVPLDA